MKGSECNKCDNSQIRALNTISCGKCNQVYHTSCLIDPLDATVCSSLKYNPSLWWLCPDCLMGINEVQPLQKSDVDLMISEKLSAAMEGIKKDILSSIINNHHAQLPNISHPRVAPCEHPENHAIATGNQGTKRKAVEESGLLSKVPRTVNSNDPSTGNVSSSDSNSYASFVKTGTPSNGTPFQTIKPRRRRVKSTKPVETEQKFLLHFRPIIDKNIVLKTEEWYQLRRTISEKLNDVKVSFSHFNPKTGKVVIGFPNEKSKTSAATILKDVAGLWCFESYMPTKMLPKLTIHSVPLDFELPPTTSSENTDAHAQRDLVKDKIWQTIIDKNEGVRSLVESGSTLEIVYFKQRDYTATVAIKVSPEIRLHIFDKCDSKLYMFSGRCKASDRCHYQQCYHCLKFGHIIKDCPSSADLPVCKFCTDRHDGKTCSKKDMPSEHKCANCKQSKSLEISRSYNTHCATSRDCPSAMSIVDKIQRNTLFALPQDNSKNV